MPSVKSLRSRSASISQLARGAQVIFDSSMAQ